MHSEYKSNDFINKIKKKKQPHGILAMGLLQAKAKVLWLKHLSLIHDRYSIRICLHDGNLSSIRERSLQVVHRYA